MSTFKTSATVMTVKHPQLPQLSLHTKLVGQPTLCSKQDCILKPLLYFNCITNAIRMTKAFHVSLRSNALLCIGVSVCKLEGKGSRLLLQRTNTHITPVGLQSHVWAFLTNSRACLTMNRINILFVLKEDLGQYPTSPCRQVLIYYVFLTGCTQQISRTETFQEISLLKPPGRKYNLERQLSQPVIQSLLTNFLRYHRPSLLPNCIRKKGILALFNRNV